MSQPMPEEDRRLWGLSFLTLQGDTRGAVLCTEHRRRYESALAFLALPEPLVELLRPHRRLRCRNCRRAGRPGGDA